MNQGKVVGVSYDSGITTLNSDQGVITLGIVNHEATKITYSIVATIGVNQINVTFDGKSLDHIGSVELQPHGKWEQEIKFAPQEIGKNQKVELLLYKDSSNSPDDTLHFWINVKQTG